MELKRQGTLAQLVARRSHNPKVVSSILTGPIILLSFLNFVSWGSASANTTPVGFEPTRAEPTGLAGRRLNHSAKVSVMLLRCREKT